MVAQAPSLLRLSLFYLVRHKPTNPHATGHEQHTREPDENFSVEPTGRGDEGGGAGVAVEHLPEPRRPARPVGWPRWSGSAWRGGGHQIIKENGSPGRNAELVALDDYLL